MHFRLASLASLPFLFLSSCEFRSHPLAWHPAPGAAFRIHYVSEMRAKADGVWGSDPYVSAARADFSAKAALDSAKGQIDLSLTVDSLDFKAADRSAEEEVYMDGRLRKYRSRISLSRTGLALALEEEPALPPMAFSPLSFGRWLAYALPAFPDAPLRQGKRWDILQPLLDKFHPDSRVAKHFTLSAIRETPAGEEAICLVELEAWLDEDVGSESGPEAPALKGSGKIVFNISKGLPESASLELEGRFRIGTAAGDTARATAGGQPMELREKVDLTFSD